MWVSTWFGSSLGLFSARVFEFKVSGIEFQSVGFRVSVFLVGCSNRLLKARPLGAQLHVRRPQPNKEPTLCDILRTTILSECQCHLLSYRFGGLCVFLGFRADGVNRPEYLLAISSAIPPKNPTVLIRLIITLYHRSPCNRALIANPQLTLVSPFQELFKEPYSPYSNCEGP